jgi:hypothetical protein
LFFWTLSGNEEIMLPSKEVVKSKWFDPPFLAVTINKVYTYTESISRKKPRNASSGTNGSLEVSKCEKTIIIAEGGPVRIRPRLPDFLNFKLVRNPECP